MIVEVGVIECWVERVVLMVGRGVACLIIYIVGG